MYVPVRPMPAEQCTTTGASSKYCFRVGHVTQDTRTKKNNQLSMIGAREEQREQRSGEEKRRERGTRGDSKLALILFFDK